jgi:hypothetical protein
MATFEGDCFDGTGRMTYAYAKFLREQERAEREAREAREYEASEAGQRAAAKKIADMDEFAGHDPWRDPIDEIVERVSKEDAS